MVHGINTFAYWNEHCGLLIFNSIISSICVSEVSLEQVTHNVDANVDESIFLQAGLCSHVDCSR